MDRREFISLGAATTACLISGCRTTSRSRAGLFSMAVLNPKCMAGGAGLCVVMRTPGGKTYLFDTANGDIYGKSPRNNGKDIIAPWLVAHGVEKIDGLIISHYHADHFGGFLWLWNHFPIERVFDCSYMMQVDGLTPHDIREYESARDALAAWEKAHPGKLVRNAGVGTDLGWDEPGLSFELLWPDPRNYVTPKKLINEGFPYHDMLNANSNALRVVYGERTFLVGGDCATMYVTEYLRPALEKAGKWGCDFCVLPGHGIGDYSEDMASMSPRPRVTVASLGDRPWMIEAGAKSQTVMTKAGFESYTTNIHGHITAVSDGHSLDIMHFDDVAKPPSSKRVLFLGDSITDKRHIGCKKNYWGFLGERYGFTPLVYGVNGQQWANIRDQVKAYRKEHAEDPDVVFVFAGTNDYNSNVPLGEWYSVSEEKTGRNGREVTLKKRTHSTDRTLRGRINVAMLAVRESFPKAHIVLLTPIHRGFAKFGANNVQPDEAYANELGLFIDDYVNVVKEAANVWSARVVDLNADAGLYPSSRAHDSFFHNAEWDRLHPSDAGHERIAEVIAMEVGDLLK